jgi:hypothetical protein
VAFHGDAEVGLLQRGDTPQLRQNSLPLQLGIIRQIEESEPAIANWLAKGPKSKPFGVKESAVLAQTLKPGNVPKAVLAEVQELHGRKAGELAR